MAGGRTLGILGGLVAAAVAAGLWLALSSDEDAPDAGAGGAANAVAGAPSDAPGVAAHEKAARRRATSAGTASIAGLVKRRTGTAPVAGQTVELLREGFDPWTAETDASGAFKLDALPDGGPFELRVEAKGFATVRLPGIGLGRGEARDAGTIWLDQAVRLPVSVRDFADKPIAGADVRAFVAPEYGDDFNWSKAFAQMAVEPVAVATTKTDAQGAAVFPELASGNWTITASAPGRARGAVRHISLRGSETPREVVIRLAAGHALTGKVLDPERKAVAGAVVLGGSPVDQWDLSGAATRTRATSDAAGTYVLEGLDAGDVALWVGRPGTVPSIRATVRIPSVERLDLVLRATGSIAGVVTEKESGKPVEGATVRATQWGMSMETAEATTDATGRYRIEAFPAGTVSELKAEKQGLVHLPPEHNMWGGGDRRVHAGDTLTQDLALVRGGTVTGKVTADGAPVAGAKVVLRVGRPNRGAEFTETVTTGADGRWRIDSAMPGPGFVEAKKEGFWLEGFPEYWWTLSQDESAGKQFRVTVPESGEASVDLVLRRGTALRGRVEGPDGPVAGAKVRAPGAEATSDAAGAFALEGVRPGRAVSVSASKQGLAALKNETFEVAADGTTPEVVVRLVRTPVVRGRVTTADGSPLRDARVALKARSDDPRKQWVNNQPVDFRGGSPVREDGSYEAEVRFTEDAFVVHVLDTAHGTAASQAIAVEEGRAEYQADIRLGAGGAIRGRVTSGGRGIAGAEVSVTEHVQRDDQMAMYKMSMGQARGAVWAVTAADGSFEARPVAEGVFDVEVSAPGHVRNDGVKTQVPQQGELVVEIAAALEISGRVTLEDGAPVEGLSVVAISQSGEQGQQFYGWDPGGDEDGRQTTSDRDGRFRLKGLAPGNYRIRADASWMSKANVRGTTSEPVAAGTADMKVTVRGGGTISGRVVGGDGKGITGAWINCNPETPAADPSYRFGMSSADGTFEVVGLGDGPFTLFVQTQGGGHQPVQKAGVAVGTKDLEIVLSTGLAIEGVIVKPDGKPVASVYVHAQRVHEEGDTNVMWTGGNQQPTDSEGRFRVSGLAAGKYRILLNDWSGTGPSLRLSSADPVPAGATGVRLVASEGMKIAGVVVDENGTGVQGAHVSVVLEGEPHRSAATDAAGRFEITGLPDGKHRLDAGAPGRAAASVAGVAAGSRDARIVLGRGLSVTVRVLDAAGKPFVGQVMLSRAADEGSGEKVAQEFGQSSQAQMTDGDGRFTAEGLAPGKWSVSAVVAVGTAMQVVRLGTVEAGGPEVELRMAK